MKNHIKGTDCFEMTRWLLERYLEFRYYRLSGMGGVRKSDTFGIDDISWYMSDGSRDRYFNCFAADNLRLTDNLADVMHNTYLRMRQDEENKADLIFGNYMTFEHEGISVAEKIRRMNYTGCGFYKSLYKAISLYSFLLWEDLRSNRSLPFFANSPEESLKLVSLMKQAYSMHEYSGKCYEDTEALLKKYYLLKYHDVQERISESGARISENYQTGGSLFDFYKVMDQITSMNVDDRLKGWLCSSMAEKTGAYIHLIDCAAESMRNLGRTGRENYSYIYTMFMDPEYADEPWSSRMESLGVSQRVYYLRRNQSISMMSKILWGPLSHRHFDSLFCSGTRKTV
ncbi:MAG: hypothetical protein SPI84_07820 [Anaerovoracaceae bacterium]|nr:hypothetical protein [Anaerovoracaceae bacterium]